ncbi:MAG: hypothetical protein KatS3mg111_1713 [Pirellulaceae bacterium]|nr:MAG: hypothetical protein KatS3mg111_1713 [Pirellulaceae bacterium]
MGMFSHSAWCASSVCPNMRNWTACIVELFEPARHLTSLDDAQSRIVPDERGHRSLAGDWLFNAVRGL